MSGADPHAEAAVLWRGAELIKARGVMIMLHGRGASAESILRLVDEISYAGFAYAAPQAAANTWYPLTFLSPRERNEPWLGSALAAVDRLYAQVVRAGLPAGRIMLLGFSQGACLAAEYAIRHPRVYGGVFVLSGGLIGDESELTGYETGLSHSPIFLGCSDVDPHIPKERVVRSAELLSEAGADVRTSLYPGLGHFIIPEEIETVRAAMSDVLGRA